MVEGMQIQSQEGTDGNSMTYFDDALVAETSVMTSAIPPDTSSGGIRINSILKDGGNVVSGAVFLGGSNGPWQSKNVDAALRARGIAAANATQHVQNFNGAMGGPVKRDTLLSPSLAVASRPPFGLKATENGFAPVWTPAVGESAPLDRLTLEAEPPVNVKPARTHPFCM